MEIYPNIFNSKIVYIINEIDDEIKLEEITKEFMLRSAKYFFAGFDCEWADKEKVSLIQISFADGCCFFIRLFNSTVHIPLCVLDWMKDRTKLKFGIAVVDDSEKLKTQWDILVIGCVDLRHLAIKIPEHGLDNMRLKSFGRKWLNLNCSSDDDRKYKSKSVQCSDWSNDQLTSQQIEYASLDGLIGALTPIEFLSRKLNVDPSDAMMQLEELRHHCRGCVDVQFKFKNKEIVDESKLRALLLNCDGTINMKLSKTKARRYLNKRLAVKVTDNPLVIKLLELNQDRLNLDSLIQDRQSELYIDVCVVCGSPDHLGRYSLVPIEYQKHYPENLRYSSLNIKIWLCPSCHTFYSFMQNIKSKELQSKYDTQLEPTDEINLSQIKKAINALHKRDLPTGQIEKYRVILADFCGVFNPELTVETLLIKTELKIKNLEQNFVPRELKVINSFVSSSDLTNFESMWREYFIQEMQPKHMQI